MHGRKNLILGLSDGNIYEESHLAWVDPFTGDVVSRFTKLIGVVQRHSLHSANINSDNQQDLVIATSRGMYITR